MILPGVTTTNIDELQQLILARATLQPGTVIGIDGINGSGKSCLAEQLAPLLRAKHINLDDFLNPSQGGFLNHLRYDELRKVISQAMAEGPVIVEGVCLREVLRRLCLEAELHIYIKHNIVCGYWQGGSFLNSGFLDEALAEEKERALRDDADTLSGLRLELINYHHKYLPHENPDFVYERRVREPVLNGAEQSGAQ